MFAKATNVGFAQQVVATLAACALVLASMGLYTTATAQAANLANVSNTLSDSDNGVTSAHEVAFTIPNPGGTAITAGDTITITFPSGFTGVGSVGAGDTSVTVNGTAVGSPTVTPSGQDVDISGVAASPGDEVVVAIDDGVVTNPGNGSYEFVVDTGVGDIGYTRVAIIDNVDVTAVVETTFDFAIAGTATGPAVNGTSTTGSSTPTAIPFGVLTAGVPEVLSQELTVSTNARNGFVVTLETDGDLQSANGAVIDTFNMASDVSDPGTAWTSPVPDVNDETTWGHWGVTTEDADLNSLGGFYTADFGANEYIAASTTPREVFHHDDPAIGTTTNQGITQVGFRVEITALQEAADDYTTTATYIATPTF